jgi:hypothetical protein
MASQSRQRIFALLSEIQPTPTMTIHELHEEIRDRRALARHAKRHGLKVARLWHVQLALNARAELRHYAGR